MLADVDGAETLLLKVIFGRHLFKFVIVTPYMTVDKQVIYISAGK